MTIELTTGQKFQIAVILVTLGLASYFIFANFKPTFDTAVNVFFTTRMHGADPTKAVDKSKNPADPKKEESVAELYCSDGEVDLVQLKSDPSRPMKIEWKPSNKRDKTKPFQFYTDPMSLLAEIKDPFEHAIGYAIYYKVYVNTGGLGLLGKIGMDTDHLAKEAEARKKMEDELGTIDAAYKNGTFRKDLLDQIVKELKTLQANTKDAVTDIGKQTQVRKVLTLASSFQHKFYEEKNLAIGKYIKFMAGLLTDEQKAKLQEVVDPYEHPATTATPAAGRRGRAGTGNITRAGRAGVVTTAPARGGVTTSPARGGAMTSPARGGAMTAPARGGPMRGPATLPATTPATSTATAPGH